MAKTVASAMQGTRRTFALGGVSAPSSTNLWDIVKKDLFENHDARHVHDIWSEVGVVWGSGVARGVCHSLPVSWDPPLSSAPCPPNPIRQPFLRAVSRRSTEAPGVHNDDGGTVRCVH